MSHISANDLKTKGIAAIEAALVEAPEAIVSVRGKDRFVVMDIAHYHYLRECELGGPPMISRRHAELQWVDGDLQLVDLDSANGTYVDGTRLTAQTPKSPSQPVKLRDGVRIKLGNLELEVVRGEG